MSGSVPASLDEARREIDRLHELAEVNAQSALLHAMRASALEMDVQRRAAQVQIIRTSTSWRVTFPIRAAAYLLTKGPRAGLRTARRVAGVVAKEGMGEAAAKVGRRLRSLAPKRARRPDPAIRDSYARKPGPAAPAILAPRVLIVAELSLPQCAKYRVWQKQAHLSLLGTDCTVLDWNNIEACRSALQTHALVIFYRVPGFADVLSLIEEAKRLQVTSFWEADDLIFDLGHYQANRNLDTLDPALRREVLSGVELFRAAMLACDRTIASTAALAERMQEAGAGPTTVIENALDAETVRAAEAVRARPRPQGGAVVVAYGSGSKAHDIDFTMAAPALAELLRRRPEVRLRLIGDLTAPAALLPHADRIERLAATGYVAYLGLLGEADISLAPLEATAFNDAKSNIKFIEAAMLGLPSVCSARANFRSVIENGANGFLADDDDAWLDALTRLVDDPALRRRLGEAARATVLGRYGPEIVARQQVAPLTAGLDRRTRPALRVLAVNIFFAPISYGGATIVAEQMAQRLQARPDTDMFVFTSRGDESAQYMLRRYDWDGVPVIAVRLPRHDVISEFDNPEMAVVFADVLRAVQPDVVHFHCVQNLSAGLLRVCQDLALPYVVTLHDAWWLCARQFMVMENDSYCFQTRIDLNVCEACVPGALHLRQRFKILMQALSGAALVLSPSESHRQLYLANGLDPERVLVNHNGIRMPERPRRRQAGDVLRFGFVGGISGLKGYHLIRKAFERIAASGYELLLVDNTLNLGFSTIDTAGWRVAGTIRTVPAYDQAGLDDFFDGIDVLLFPSQWKESFGLIVCEALARDVWVVVTEGVGAAEFVVDGENGTVIPLVNDPRPLREAVEALLAAPERLAGHVNRHKALLNTYDAQAEDLHGMLERAVSRG